MGFSLLEYVAALLDMHWWWKDGSTRLRRPSDWEAAAKAVAEGSYCYSRKICIFPELNPPVGAPACCFYGRLPSVKAAGGRGNGCCDVLAVVSCLRGRSSPEELLGLRSHRLQQPELRVGAPSLSLGS
jgi:hypothetical protein